MGKVIDIVKWIFVIGLIAFILFNSGIFGSGNGFNFGNLISNSDTDENKNEETYNEETQNEEVIIKVEENKIYFGEEECADTDDLKDRINKIHSQNKDMKFIFEHENAIKSTYDEVKKILISLEETLEISIDYNE